MTKKIAYKNLPAKLPLFPTITTYLALAHFNAPGWLYGALAVIWVLIWGAAIYDLHNQETVDIMADDVEVKVEEKIDQEGLSSLAGVTRNHRRWNH